MSSQIRSKSKFKSKFIFFLFKAFNTKAGCNVAEEAFFSFEAPNFFFFFFEQKQEENKMRMKEKESVCVFSFI